MQFFPSLAHARVRLAFGWLWNVVKAISVIVLREGGAAVLRKCCAGAECELYQHYMKSAWE